MTDALLVITTTENQADGERLAMLLVERELAACVQVVPQITSVYRWQGSVEQTNETLLFIKSTRAIYQHLEETIKQNHSYQTPEIIALPIESGSAEYLTWLTSVVEFQG